MNANLIDLAWGDPRSMLAMLLLGVLAGLLGYALGSRDRHAADTPARGSRGQEPSAPSKHAGPVAGGPGRPRPTGDDAPRGLEDGETLIDDPLAPYRDNLRALGRATAEAHARSVRRVIEDAGTIDGRERAADTREEDWRTVGRNLSPAAKAVLEGAPTVTPGQLCLAIEQLVGAIYTIASASDGIAGLYANGDPAPWGDLLKGGPDEAWLGVDLEHARDMARRWRLMADDAASERLKARGISPGNFRPAFAEELEQALRNRRGSPELDDARPETPR